MFKSVLSYIYTGQVNYVLSLEQAVSMMITAGKYNLDHLKALCENRLAVLLTAKNAAHILVVADNLSCSKLKCEALKYITKDIDLCGDIMKTEGWKKVRECKALVEEVLTSVVDHSSKRRKLS